MASNNSVGGKDWGATLDDKVKGKKPNGNLKPGKGQVLAGVANYAVSSSSSSGGGGGSSRSGGGGSGGGGGVAEAPTADEARAIVMAGMKQYLGREASSKEVKAFFKNFTQYAGKNNNAVNSGMQDEFLQDWIDDRPELRKEYAQYSMATKYVNALDRAMNSVKAL